MGNASLWKATVDDFEALCTGRVRGRVIAPRPDDRCFKFVVLFAKADEKTRSDDWGLPHHNAADECCPECCGNRTSRPVTDLQGSAAWRTTMITSVRPYVERMRKPLHPLASSKLMWRGLFYADYMHICDVHGCNAIIYGSLICILLLDPRLGRTKAARLHSVNKFMAEWYEENPGVAKLPHVIESNLKLNHWSEMHGPAIKAANSRNAAPLFSALAREHFDELTEEGRHILIVTSKLEEWYAALKSAGLCFTDHELHELQQITDDLTFAWQSLRAIAQKKSRLHWQIKGKAHKLCHMPFWAGILNPRIVSCYSDESHIGTVCSVWKGSMGGTYAQHVQRNVLLKRFLGVVVRYELDKEE